MLLSPYWLKVKCRGTNTQDSIASPPLSGWNETPFLDGGARRLVEPNETARLL